MSTAERAVKLHTRLTADGVELPEWVAGDLATARGYLDQLPVSGSSRLAIGADDFINEVELQAQRNWTKDRGSEVLELTVVVPLGHVADHVGDRVHPGRAVFGGEDLGDLTAARGSRRTTCCCLRWAGSQRAPPRWRCWPSGCSGLPTRTRSTTPPPDPPGRTVCAAARTGAQHPTSTDEIAAPTLRALLTGAQAPRPAARSMSRTPDRPAVEMAALAGHAGFRSSHSSACSQPDGGGLAASDPVHPQRIPPNH